MPPELSQLIGVNSKPILVLPGALTTGRWSPSSCSADGPEGRLVALRLPLGAKAVLSADLNVAGRLRLAVRRTA